MADILQPAGDIAGMPLTGMNGFTVTPDEVQHTSITVGQAADEISRHLSELRTYVGALDQYWQGPAHLKFLELMTDYDKCAWLINNALSQISNGLDRNYQTYVQVEQDVHNSLNAIQLPMANFGTA